MPRLLLENGKEKETSGRTLIVLFQFIAKSAYYSPLNKNDLEIFIRFVSYSITKMEE
jgi:hypothetical protein